MWGSLKLTPVIMLFCHISADVAEFSVGSNPPPFTASTTSGLYLNLESPAQCNGLITTWHYCYYPPSAAGSRSFTVGVWRQAAQQYTLVGSSRTITVMAETSLASVICGTETLMEESDYMSINENDFIGVIIPPSSPLPVVASGASDYRLKRFDDINVMSFGSTALQDLPDQALHLHANISECLRGPHTQPVLAWAHKLLCLLCIELTVKAIIMKKFQPRTDIWR